MTVQELIKQYETDEKLRAEVKDILKDGRVTIPEIMKFAKKHDVDITLEEIVKYMAEAKKLGFLK